MDDDERKQARVFHNELVRAQEIADQLPPLWGKAEPEPCATCGQPAYQVKKLEGREVRICADCALKEMDEWEAAHGPNG